MFPWAVNWAPVIRLPWSGEVVQDIQPETALFGQIKPGAGDPAIEKRIFEDVASYGKQLGIITRVILEQSTGTNSEALTELRSIAQQADAIKTAERVSRGRRAKSAMLSLKASDPAGFEALMKELESLPTPSAVVEPSSS